MQTLISAYPIACLSDATACSNCLNLCKTSSTEVQPTSWFSCDCLGTQRAVTAETEHTFMCESNQRCIMGLDIRLLCLCWTALSSLRLLRFVCGCWLETIIRRSTFQSFWILTLCNMFLVLHLHTFLFLRIFDVFEQLEDDRWSGRGGGDTQQNATGQNDAAAKDAACMGRTFYRVAGAPQFLYWSTKWVCAHLWVIKVLFILLWTEPATSLRKPSPACSFMSYRQIWGWYWSSHPHLGKKKNSRYFRDRLLLD